MEVLLTGNTEFITPEWAKAAFPEDHAVVSSSSDKSLIKQLNETYEFNRVVYFSENLVPHTEDEGGLDRLERFLETCAACEIKMLYISPFASENGAFRGKEILEKTAEKLCFYFGERGGMQIKILRSPYLYDAHTAAANRYFGNVFERMESGDIEFSERSDCPACFLCMDDLAELIERVFDSWEAEQPGGVEILSVPDVFNTTYGELGDALGKLSAGETNILFGESSRSRREDDKILRTRYSWFPRYNILDDLPAMYKEWKAAQIKKKGILGRIWEKIKLRNRFVIALEILAAWIVTELLVRVADSQTQFSVIDFRLLFIVIIATIRGLTPGLFAAALASASLAVSYWQQGASFVLMFYEPSNWLAYIAYFVAGAVCGYVQLRNVESVRFVQEENENIRERLHFVRNLYQDTLDEKRSFRKQILGREDSFGKIYEATRQLDEMQPRKLFEKTVDVMEKLLGNKSIMLYRVSPGSHFARLVAKSPSLGAEAIRSIDLNEYTNIVRELDENGIFVNRELLPDVPMFAAGVHRNGRLVMVIALLLADESQQSLYFQNLFSILCGLVEESLLRALDYETAVREEMYFQGSNVLREKHFAGELETANAMQENRVASHLLLRVTNSYDERKEMFDALRCAIRESDTAGMAPDGSICLLMHQAGDEELPIIRERLEKKGIYIEKLSADDELRFIRMAKDDGKSDEGLLTGETGE